MDDDVKKMWATLQLEVSHDPASALLPWDLHAYFTYPKPMSVHWGSFETEAAANEMAKYHTEKYLRKFSLAWKSEGRQ